MEKFNQLIESATPTLVDFHATWCAPCKMMSPILEELKGTVGEGVTIVTVDVDNHANQRLVSRHNIQSVPTLVLFKSGKQVWRQSGVVDARTLKCVIDSNA